MNQLAVITGTTHGIGRVTASELARAGRHVVMLCRNLALSDAVAAQIRQTIPSARVDTIACDLADFGSVQAAAGLLRASHPPPDLLILNAGMAATTRQRTADGMDLNFAVNHLGHFLLVELLRDRMAPAARIITVASAAHTRARLDLAAVADPAERISPFASYARSKLANLMHSLALARRLEGGGISASSLHPGIVATHLLPRWVRWLQRILRGQMFPAERGAHTTLHLALADAAVHSNGLYFDEHALPRAPSARAQDVVMQEALWSRSMEWVRPWLPKVSAS